jgi:hypothetical protein
MGSRKKTSDAGHAPVHSDGGVPDMTSFEPPECRGRLIELAQLGQINPAQAESLAAHYGSPAFATQPASHEFNPLQIPRWSIVMAASWIAWRDIETTRNQHAEFRAQSTRWVPREWTQPRRLVEILRAAGGHARASMARMPFSGPGRFLRGAEAGRDVCGGNHF